MLLKEVWVLIALGAKTSSGYVLPSPEQGWSNRAAVPAADAGVRRVGCQDLYSRILEGCLVVYLHVRSSRDLIPLCLHSVYRSSASFQSRDSPV